MIAETAGLVGASRRVSPASEGGAQRFDVTSLREWLTFTAEPAHIGATALIAGVINQTGEPPLLLHVRPLDAAGDCSATFTLRFSRISRWLDVPYR